jgi:hypothetical protein
MSTMTHIRPAPHYELASVVQDEKRSKRECAIRSTLSEIGLSLMAIAAGVLIMTGLVALRLWFLMPGAFHFAS